MAFVADDLTVWLIGLLADAGRRKLAALVLGDEQERALRKAATAAVRITAENLHPGSGRRAEELAMVVSHVFAEPAPVRSAGAGLTLLEALQEGVAVQLAVLDDASLTGTEKSSAELLGLPTATIAEELTGQLVAQIVVRGARGGPLEPLASQLNHDASRLQGQRLEGLLRQLVDLVAGEGRPLVSGVELRYSLPPDTAAFTGRDADLDQIATSVTGAAAVGGVAAVHVIGGMPGVGKTALAVHAAHRLRDRFPDRQLFIDLHAHTPGQDPVLPEAALAGLLTATGVDARYLPEDLDGRAGLWRDRIAGQRVLLVLDNAASSAQVTPLLPASAGCLVLVTSRRHLADLPATAVPLPLETLPPEEAAAMFLRLAPRAAVGGPDGAVPELVRLAGYLPLAISLLARVYARHRSWTLADLTAETAVSLLTLTAEKDSIAAAFDVSYRHLATSQQRFFRRLGLHPGTTIDACAAAALAAVSARDAVAGLDALHREGLLTETGYRRYGMHDLIRRFSQDLGAEDPEQERLDALDRLAHACYGCVNYAFNEQNRGNPMVDAEFLDSWQAADPPGIQAVREAASPTAWFAAEQANLIAVTQAAHAAGLAITSRLACSMFYFLEVAGHFDEWEKVERIGKEAAVSPLDQARSLRNRGRLALVRAIEEQERLYDDSDPRPSPAEACRKAIPLLEESRDLYQACGNRAGEATALRELADALRLEADPGSSESADKAIRAYRAAEHAYTAMGNKNALASLTQAMGMTYARARQYDEAESCFRASLDFASTEDGGRARHGRLKAYSLRRLADLYRDKGNLDQAVEYYEKCIKACQVDVDDPIGRARALSICGRTQGQRNQLNAARDHLSSALELFAQRPLGRSDPEAQVAGAWLGHLNDRSQI